MLSLVSYSNYLFLIDELLYAVGSNINFECASKISNISFAPFDRNYLYVWVCVSFVDTLLYTQTKFRHFKAGYAWKILNLSAVFLSLFFVFNWPRTEF